MSAACDAPEKGTTRSEETETWVRTRRAPESAVLKDQERKRAPEGGQSTRKKESDPRHVSEDAKERRH